MGEQVELTVPKRLHGSRLDKALSTLLGVSRALAKESVEQGVLVDGVAARASDRVTVGQQIVARRRRAEFDLVAEAVDFDVEVEEPDFLVVNKPPGLVVHPGSARTTATLAAGLLFRYPDIEQAGQPGRWGIVHRLDRDTSGLMIVARTPEAYRALSQQIRDRRVDRRYVALVDGEPRAPTGTIEAPIGRDPVRPTRRAVVRGGKPAVTHFEVLSVYKDSEASLLEVRLETGRTHQIRVHMSSIGHQVIGDRVYARKVTLASAPRVFLHAHHLGLTHPSTGERVEAEAPLPGDLQRILDGMSGLPG